MFPQTSNGQKPVDMFLTAILRTGTKNDYLFRFLVPRRDGSFDVKSQRIINGLEEYSRFYNTIRRTDREEKAFLNCQENMRKQLSKAFKDDISSEPAKYVLG